MATFPTIYAGQRITSALLTSMLPIAAFKAANTDRTATTTLADDPDLSVQIAANATYRVVFYLHYAATNVARFKTAWTVPSGTTGNRAAVGPDQGVVLSSTSSGGQGRWGVHNFVTACTYGTRDSSSNQCFAQEEATIFTTAAGTLAIQWAQVTSDASVARLAAGSSMHVQRLA
ncbi:hypothetical protein DV517_62380 [Streptomyces sp. S816]|uniref:hypothetical protein n=1 Tax=Streptomyces sp. S816 TaxID=2283197 RepID=UPI00109CEE02|nr:hypothetical protein [Streptomyces sp. S816]TGZ14755.1 hypothetical protein DV517_62380 [Streptomyces sp. S816]